MPVTLAADVALARVETLAVFGSGSVAEPRADLHALGILPPERLP